MKNLIIMFAIFLALAACESKSPDVNPDAGPTVEEKAGSKEAPKADAGTDAAQAADASAKDAPKPDMGATKPK